MVIAIRSLFYEARESSPKDKSSHQAMFLTPDKVRCKGLKSIPKGRKQRGGPNSHVFP